MATIPLGAASVAKTISGNSPQVIVYPEAANQTFKKGQFVYLSGGYVTVCSSSSTAILGMAAEDAHNGSTNGAYNVAVYIANSDTLFELNKVTAAGAATTTAVTDVGANFGIYVDSTNKWCHAAVGSGSTPHRLICVALSDKDEAGDAGGRLLCMVLGVYNQLFTTS